MVATGAVPAELPVLLDRLDQVWGSLGFDARWQREGEHVQAAKALERFLNWHADARGREWVASEWEFSVPYEDTRISGSFDRVELDADGRIVVVDFKTSKSPPGEEKVANNPQLAVYQLAVLAGALEGKVPGEPVSGGAELVQLRTGRGVRSGGDGLPKIQPQAPLGPGEDGDGGAGEDHPVRADSADWAGDLVRSTAAGIRSELFVARVNERCNTCVYQRACPAQDAGASVVS